MRNQKGRLAVISEHACNWNRLDSPCRKLIGDPGASERAYRTRVVADRQKALSMMNMPHDRLERNADVSNRDPLPKAQQTRQTVNLQLCCEFNSWQICGACNSAQRSHACGHAQDSVAMGEQVNLHLLPQGLTRSILEAICPVQANFGPLLESKDQFGRGNGYRFHSSMVTFLWHCRSIEDRVAGLFPQKELWQRLPWSGCGRTAAQSRNSQLLVSCGESMNGSQKSTLGPTTKLQSDGCDTSRRKASSARCGRICSRRENSVWLGPGCKAQPVRQKLRIEARWQKGSTHHCWRKMKRQNRQQTWWVSNATTWRCFPLRFLMWVWATRSCTSVTIWISGAT